MKKEDQIKGQGFDKPLLTLLAFVLIALIAVTTISCGENGEAGEEAGENIGVVVTILPQAEFVEKIGGEKVDITVMVPSGASPHTYEPKPSQMVALARAIMYAKVGSGVDFELVWWDDLIEQNKDVLVVDCSEGVSLTEMAGEHQHEGEEDEHEEEGQEHGDMDPHIWMSPLNTMVMVQNICDGLVQVDPDNRAYYQGNRDDYLEELMQLGQDIRDGLSGVVNRRFMVYHPAFGYFAEEYGLTMIPVEDEGKEPTGPGITHVIEQAREYNIKVIFASPQFSQRIAEVIAGGIGGEVVSIDPLARNYIANMRLILGELVEAME